MFSMNSQIYLLLKLSILIDKETALSVYLQGKNNNIHIFIQGHH